MQQLQTARQKSAARDIECVELERLADDKSVNGEIDGETLSGIYSRTHAPPQCENCARLQADNRVLLLASYKRQGEILELLGGEHNDSCCCFVIKFG